MKANEAPKKIHIQPNAQDRWFEGSVPNGLPNGLFVEYTRTDAFIEKAAEYLMDYEFNDSPTIVDRRKRVDKFRKYMKGE